MEERPPDDARIGAILAGRYRILETIAAGGMGIVYRAERIALGRAVAVKFLHPEVARQPSIVKRFETEARAASRLAHPNCVPVIDYGVEGAPFLVMDLVHGSVLRSLVDEPFAPRRAIHIVRQVLAALAHAHSHGIIHRDIKPENVILEQGPGLEDHVRVLDFGLAKLKDAETALTTGLAVGTPNYMAPEQTREGGIDERVDVYAAGVLLFELLTGRKPFDAPSLGEVFLRVQQMPPPRPSHVRPGLRLSAPLEAVVIRAMAKAPDERFPSAAVMAKALETVPEMTGEGARAEHAAAAAAIDATVHAPAPLHLPSGIEPTIAASAEPVLRRAGRRVTLTGARVSAGWRSFGPRGLAFVKSLRARLARSLGWVGGSRRRRGGVAVAFAVLLLLAVGNVAVGRRTKAPVVVPQPSTTVPDAPAPTAAAPEVPREGPAPAIAGEGEAEIARVRGLRKREPRNAEHAATLARLYFEKRWFDAGLASFRTAVELDPKRKSDPVLLGHAVTALGNDRVSDRAWELLTDYKASARPVVTEAARSHPSAKVRGKARELLARWNRKSFWPW